MFLHPLLLTILVIDIIGTMLALAAGVKACQIIVAWNPAVSDRRQIELEIQSEALAIQGYWVLGLLHFSTVLYVVGITNILPGVVPGAMCGTGIMQALGDSGFRALILRMLALAILSVWFITQRINFGRPEAPLTRTCARLVLVAMPAYLPALYETFTAVMNLNLQQPVSCCAMVYDQYRTLEEAQSTAGLPDSVWLSGFLIGAVVMFVLTVFVLRSPKPVKGSAPIFLVVLCGAWVPVAAVTLVHILAAYHYGVLQHQCPWCLFLVEYRLVGFPLFGALALVIFEALVVMLLPRLARTATELRSIVEQRVRKACLLILGSVIVFLLISGMPPIIWRMRFGVWLN